MDYWGGGNYIGGDTEFYTDYKLYFISEDILEYCEPRETGYSRCYMILY